jgi:hypothetical protein
MGYLMNNTYKLLIDKHTDCISFILGAGPSLCDVVRSPYFLNIFNHVAVFVNSSILVLPSESEFKDMDFNRYYWISNDALCRRWDWWKRVRESKCIKVVRDSWSKYRDELDGFLWFSPRSTPEGVVNDEDDGLAYCSSVPTALDLSIKMGCKKIFLLGVDHAFPDSNKTHFYHFLYPPDQQPKSNGIAQGSIHQRKGVFEINKKAFHALNLSAERKGVKVYNCCRSSSIEEFEKVSFDNIMKGIIS